MVLFKKLLVVVWTGAVFCVGGGCTSSEKDSQQIDNSCDVVPTTDKRVQPDLASALDAVMVEHFAETGSTGAVASVYVPKMGFWYGTAGLAEAGKPEPIATNTRILTGCITKMFVGAVALDMVHQGLMSLDDPVTNWVTEWNLDPGVTIRSLLSHTSGIEYGDDIPENFELSICLNSITPEEVTNVIMGYCKFNPPGAAYSFNVGNYFLLGLAMERIEGKPLSTILRERVFGPSEFENIYLHKYEQAMCPLGVGHLMGMSDVPQSFDMSCAWASGGLVVSITEMIGWLTKLLNGQVLPVALVEEMKTPSPQSVEAEFPYGLGLVQKEIAGRKVWGHTGATMGFVAIVFCEPGSGICVSDLFNESGGNPWPIDTALWNVIEEYFYK